VTEIRFGRFSNRLIGQHFILILKSPQARSFLIGIMQGIQAATDKVTKVIKVQKRLLHSIIKLFFALAIVKGKLSDDLIEFFLSFGFVENFLVENFELDAGHDGLLVVFDTVDDCVFVVFCFGFEHWAVFFEKLCKLLFC
jgi:hypothetical protein